MKVFVVVPVGLLLAFDSLFVRWLVCWSVLWFAHLFVAVLFAVSNFVLSTAVVAAVPRPVNPAATRWLTLRAGLARFLWQARRPVRPLLYGRPRASGVGIVCILSAPALLSAP